MTLRRAVFMLAVATFVGLLAGILALLWRESLQLTNPPGYIHPREPGFKFQTTPLSEYGIEYEDMELAAPDGGTIRGWLIPGPHAATALAVVAVHGRGGDRTSHLRHMPMLRDTGAAVVLVDLRENGLSDGQGRGMALAMREADDALAVAADLRRRGYQKVVLFGCSLGASAALVATARAPSIAGVIAESPIESFGAYVRDNTDSRLRERGLQARLFTSAWGNMVVAATRFRLGIKRLEDPINVVANIAPRPILIIHGLADGAVPVAHSQNLAERAGPGAAFVTVPGAAHCNGFDVAPEEFTTQVRSILASISAD